MKIEVVKVAAHAAIAAFGMLSAGCANQGYSVIASTGTVIGVNLGQQPANGALDATLGYKRAEFAFVPTNRNAGEDAGANGDGAKDSANVIMELKYSGIFSTSANSGIYQRLAVGDIAVTQTGAAVLFAKAPDGTLSPEALQAVRGLGVVDPAVESAKRQLTGEFLKSRSDASTAAKYDAAAAGCGFKDYGTFAGDISAPSAKVKCVRAALVNAGVALPN